MEEIMWIRAELKSKAKAFLKKNYLTAFFVSFLVMIVTGTAGTGNKNSLNVNMDRDFISNQIWDFNPFSLNRWMAGGIIVVIGVFIVILLLRIFIGALIEVGGHNYFLRGTERDVHFNEIFFGFNSENYMNIVITMFIKGLYNFLWFLLLIIPGIVKYYAYSMVPYILSDNPNIESDRAIDLSIKMTNGQKWDMFILDLSFFGWYILASIIPVVGQWLVNPYVDSTKAHLYVALRQNAMNSGICKPEELSFVEAPVQRETWYEDYDTDYSRDEEKYDESYDSEYVDYEEEDK